jgi:predicted DNA-binding protein (MmcQ/YjbR family)
MNIEEFRDYCLSMPGAEEKMPFTGISSVKDRDLLVFQVGGKWFCFVDVDGFEYCDLKCEPDKAVELREQYEGVKAGYHMNKRHWISIYFGTDVNDETIRELVRNSYKLVVKSLNKQQREALASLP